MDAWGYAIYQDSNLHQLLGIWTGYSSVHEQLLFGAKCLFFFVVFFMHQGGSESMIP